MPRYFVKIAYNGGNFSGWQRQLNAMSIQESIEEAFSVFTKNDIQIVGCGRTDAGVHASKYVFHLDIDELNDLHIYKLNSILPISIVIQDYCEVANDAHARFDANKRAYNYFLHVDKNPFKENFSARMVALKDVNIEKLQSVGDLIMSYDSYFPFCKSNHDARTLECDISKAEWKQIDDNSYQFNIVSNRFLRGMVRLIVGACINVGLDKISLGDVKKSMDEQSRLKRSYAVPAQGLFLSDVAYPISYFKN